MDIKVDINEIKSKSIKVLVINGLSNSDAECLVNTFLEADINGVYTHGIRMLSSYVKKIKRGDFTFDDPEIIKQLPAFTIIDANNNIGAI